MKRLCLLLVLFAACTVPESNQPEIRYPSYEDVVNKFYNLYSLEGLPANTTVRFEKCPEGWRVSAIAYSQKREVLRSALLWNKDSNDFMPIDFAAPPTAEHNEGLRQKDLNNWNKRFYKLCPYFGYPSWDQDVIRDYNDLTHASDSTRYAVGRAYSAYAGNLLNNNSGLADSSIQFGLADGLNSMNEEQLAEYRKYRRKAIAIFEDLAKDNPDFKTIVGPIGVKAANEHLTAFLDLRQFQNEEEAQKELAPDLYSPFYMALARNYLNSCAPNAILFTNGDNDTYPLLYAQAQYGVRPDVQVVNLSLLNTSRYLDHLRQPVLEADALPVSLTREELSGSKLQFILLEGKREKPMDVKEVLSYLRVEENKTDAGYYSIPGRVLMCRTSEGDMTWQVSGSYFLRNHLILVDILANADESRPIYWSSTTPRSSRFGLDGYLQMEGMTYRLGKQRMTLDSKDAIAVNTQVMYDNLVNNFDWSWKQSLTKSDKLMGMNYRHNFNRLAQSLIAENQLDSAKTMLDMSVQIMPNEIFAYDQYLIPLIQGYYQVGAFEEGNQVALQLIDNLNKGVDNFDDLPYDRPEDYVAASKEHLDELAREYEQKDILAALK